METSKVTMMIRNQTPGALRFEEVDEHGKVVTMKDPKCKIGTLYIRKQGFPELLKSEIITVTIEPGV